jgi:superfamily II DNA or RNA helicase
MITDIQLENPMVSLKKTIRENEIITWFKNHCGYLPYQYQIEQIIKLFDLKDLKEKIVLAIAPNGGKTNISICYLDLLIKENPNLKVLVLAHNTSILRKNFYDRILKLNPNFTHKNIIAKDVAVGDEFIVDVNVTVSIPATIHFHDLPKFDLLVVDEAHQYYDTPDDNRRKGKSMVQKIIDKTKVKSQLLLTGTPSPFIRKGGFELLSVCGLDIYKEGNSAEVYVEHATSSYFIKSTDYTKHSDDVRLDFEFDNDDTEKTLEDVMNKVFHRIIGVRNPKTNSLKELVSPIFDWGILKLRLKRTIIACRNVPQADVVFNFFKNKGIKTIQSDYESDNNNKQLELFLEDKSYKILVVVRKGVLGLDDETIENAIDMTMSKNIDRIFQLFNRVTRKLGDTKKLFIKVCPSNRVDEFKIRLCAVVCMLDKEWYNKFNGKNFFDLKLPKKKSVGTGGTTGGTSGSGGNKPKSLEYLGIPEPEFMFDALTTNRSKIFAPESWVTTTEIDNRLRHYNDQTRKEITMDMIIELYSSFQGRELKDMNVGRNTGIIAKARQLGVHDDLLDEYEIIRHGNDWTEELVQKFIDKHPVKFFTELSDYKNGAGVQKFLRKNRELKLKFFPDVVERLEGKLELEQEMINIVLKKDENGERLYKSRADLKIAKVDVKAYNWFKLNGKINELATYFYEWVKPNDYWTKERSIEEALKIDENGVRIYKNITEFKSKKVVAARVCEELGLLFTDCKFEKTSAYEAWENREDRNRDRENPTKEEILEAHKLFKTAKEVEKHFNITSPRYKNVCKEYEIEPLKKETCQLTKEEIMKAQEDNPSTSAKGLATLLGITYVQYKKRSRKFGIYRSLSPEECSRIANESKKNNI